MMGQVIGVQILIGLMKILTDIQYPVEFPDGFDHHQQ